MNTIYKDHNTSFKKVHEGMGNAPRGGRHWKQTTPGTGYKLDLKPPRIILTSTTQTEVHWAWKLIKSLART
jgi:hypothetical protein